MRTERLRDLRLCHGSQAPVATPTRRGEEPQRRRSADAGTRGRRHCPSMWKLSRGRVLLDEPPEEEDGLPELPPPALAAAPAQGASFRGWKEVTSLFNKDDEQYLLESRKPPKSRGANSRLKEELKTEKKSGFWDSLVLKQNTQSKKPDEIEGWEPPRLALEDAAANSGDALGSCPPWPEWEDATKGSTKYTSLASSGGSSRWSLRSAGKLVSIRRQSKGHLRDGWEEAE
ncbi:testis development-related protein isoform X2 [Oryctolagus cuniculus]|uniref:testis development-related protein isoform X2 n=1 Tax=Oryctolagus cuniculus TaxID=9986 RepID=UPI00222FD6FC|nr:testis development-related protein isoform X3 [Oryctolagus cuniculus]